MSEKFDPKACDYPVVYTQGGGYARLCKSNVIFVTDPDCPGLKVGDEVPEEWDFIPANTLAREILEGSKHGEVNTLIEPVLLGAVSVIGRTKNWAVEWGVEIRGNNHQIQFYPASSNEEANELADRLRKEQRRLREEQRRLRER